MAESKKNTKTAAADKPPKKVVKKKAKKKQVPQAICHIKAEFGNIIITYTDLSGDTLCWSSAGIMGFKGKRKGTPFAAQTAATDAAEKALACGVKSVDILVKGPGPGRESAIRVIGASGMRVNSMRDVTALPHNGCRPPKQRRI